MNVLDWLSDPTALNDVGTGLQAGGQFLGAMSRFTYGQEQQQAAKFQSSQLREQAMEAEAAGQRSAWSADLATKYLASRQLAAAAAGGGGASDPTVVNIMARTAAEGAYRSATALYNGEDRARYLNLQADAKDYEGEILRNQSESAGKSQAVAGAASLLRGTVRDASLFQRFGGGGPATLDATPNTVD